MSMDTISKQKPFVSSSLYKIVIAPGTLSTVHLHVDSTSIEQQGLQQLSSSLDFNATISSTGEITNLYAVEPPMCKDGIDPKSTRLLDLIIPAPHLPVSLGDQWTDTSTTMICHGKTALEQQAIRSYKLLRELPWENRNTLEIESRTSIKLHGFPTDSINPITAEGGGSGIGLLTLDAETGLLLKSFSTSDLSLLITTSRGRFPVSQHSVIRITQQ